MNGTRLQGHLMRFGVSLVEPVRLYASALQATKRSWDAYHFRKLDTRDRGEAWRLLDEVYVGTEPVNVCLGASVYETRLTKKESVEAALEQRVSVGVFHSDSKGLVAMAMGTIGNSVAECCGKYESRLPLKTRQIKQLIRSIMPPAGLQQFVKTGDAFVVYNGMACKREHMGGLAQQMNIRFEDIARDAECNTILAVTTSYFVQRRAAENGYVTIKEIPYGSYVDPITNVKIFRNMPEPHRSISLIAKYL